MMLSECRVDAIGIAIAIAIGAGGFLVLKSIYSFDAICSSA
jgi:hypothetical protein